MRARWRADGWGRLAPITTAYAGVLGLLFVGLAVRVIRLRRSTRVPLGAGSDPILERAIRVHGNFAEYVPLALVLMLLTELAGTPARLLAVVGLALVVGRAVHAYGVSQRDETHRLRTVGMALTFATVIVLALTCLIQALVGLAGP